MSDLKKPVKVVWPGATPHGEPSDMSLFEAVRKCLNDDPGRTFEIELDGRRLSKDDIQKIANSEDFKNMLLAWDERR
ncbi:MAG: hypothetical protein JO254_11685 [Pseudolabrys sp.]|nr:hypothetical protein [Pseudolabrys sp.]